MSEPVIRPLRGVGEYRACVALQRRTWGDEFGQVVPESMLMVAQEMGGVASGAFEGDRLVGFVFGISGVRDGSLAHWSDMLAVEPDWRGRGLGRRLKLHQRERLLALGIERMLWTFDPLVARNAHLNLTRLGATARAYKRDAYGDSPSPLHAGIGTDRLVADWALASERVRHRIGEHGLERDTLPGGGAAGEPAPIPSDGAPFLVAAEPGDPFPRPTALRPASGGGAAGDKGDTGGPPVLRIAVPADIQALKAGDLELARAWRQRLREAFEWAFGVGLVAVELERVDHASCAYTLARDF